MEIGGRKGEDLSQVGVGSVVQGEPVNGEAVQAGALHLSDVASNDARIVRVVGFERGIRGATARPICYVVPGEVVSDDKWLHIRVRKGDRSEG